MKVYFNVVGVPEEHKELFKMQHEQPLDLDVIPRVGEEMFLPIFRSTVVKRVLWFPYGGKFRENNIGGPFVYVVIGPQLHDFRG